MINIKRTNTNQTSKAKNGINKKTSQSQQTSKTFSVTLNDSITANSVDPIENLMDDLSDHEKKFLNTHSLYELMKYKAKLQQILKLIMNEGFSTKQLRRRTRAGMTKRADFTVIETINEKIEQLTAAVTNSNKAFNLMKSIEEIRGLVFDLVH